LKKYKKEKNYLNENSCEKINMKYKKKIKNYTNSAKDKKKSLRKK